MEHILGEIVKIDQQAQQIAASSGEKEMIKNDAKLQKILSDSKLSTELKIAAYSEERTAYLAEQSKLIDQQLADRLQAMDHAYQMHKDEWIDTLTNLALHGDR